MMLKTLGFAVAFVGASLLPASAQSVCQEPIAPTAPKGETITEAQLHVAADDAKTFLRQSDDYQECLIKEVNDAQADAVKNKKTLDPAIAINRDTKIKSNQHLKEQVVAEYTAAAKIYLSKHPNE